MNERTGSVAVPRQRGVLDRGAMGEAGEAAVVLGHREPRPALVAQEELVVRAPDRQRGRDRHRLGVHDVGAVDALRRVWNVLWATAWRAPPTRQRKHRRNQRASGCWERDGGTSFSLLTRSKGLRLFELRSR